jgi:cation diffusion facilitator CzcD-associated flavoprotein CzcO
VVAVVGVGSSGIQVIPELAKTVKKLIIYQRSVGFVKDFVHLF